MPRETTNSAYGTSTVAKLFKHSEAHDVHDLVGIGFGPASLAIAVALYDVLEERATEGNVHIQPKIKFLELQASFGWHAGMLLPGTKMQISFIKDLATMRNPRSHFTFLNYLKHHNRLVQFCNLDSFLPLRIEFEDYLKWCAAHFSDIVQYAQHVTSVKPVKIGGSAKFNCLEVQSTNSLTGVTNVLMARSIVIAVGGRPSIPPTFPRAHPKIIHSSSYSQRIGQVLSDKNALYNIAVIGAGQSAAEIFNDLQHRFPSARTSLIMRDSALRPSDDSPFVNEVFNPEAVDEFYSSHSTTQDAQLRNNKATNYSVVRLTLLEEIYQTMYYQRLQDPNPENWQYQVLPCRKIVSVSESGPAGKLGLTIHDKRSHIPEIAQELQVDAIILATGYIRDTHNQILKECSFVNGSQDGIWTVGRDYQVKLNRELVDSDVSIYLQGCNEQTHGLSDSLLSNLAIRGGEVVNSVFGRAFLEADEAEKLRANNSTISPTSSPDSELSSTLRPS